MISKKVLGPALTGTGAVGASGALAWTLGLLDEEILDDVVDGGGDAAAEAEPKPQEKGPSDPEKQTEAPRENQDARRVNEPDERARATKEKTDKAAAASASSKGLVNAVPRGGIQERPGARLAGKAIIAGQSAISPYFSSKTESEPDRKVIEQGATWKVEWNEGLESLWVEAEGEREEDGTNFS